MPLPILGPLVSAGLSVGESLVNSIFGNKAAKEQAEQQNELNMKNWYAQQEYNSPKNQMQRYVDAGLNPQLIYGQGTPGNASAPVQQEAPQRTPPKFNILPAMTSAVQIQALQQQVENLKSNQELIEANARLKEQQTDLAEKQTNWYDYLSSAKGAMIGSNIDLNKVKQGLAYGQIDKMDSEIMLNKQRAAFMGSENVRQDTMNASKLKLINFQMAETNQRRLKELAETELKKAITPWQKSIILSALAKNDAAVAQMNQGVNTAKSAEVLNTVKAALEQYRIDGFISDKVIGWLSKLGSTFK